MFTADWTKSKIISGLRLSKSWHSSSASANFLQWISQALQQFSCRLNADAGIGDTLSVGQCWAVGTDFLISLNQSNWRFANEKLANFASQLNVPSLILQYTEYLRITKAGNHEYDDKLIKYENIVGKYVRILKQKENRLFGG